MNECRTITYYKFIKPILFVFLFLTLSNFAKAATITWVGFLLGNGNWSTGSNWVGGSVPASTDDVVFNELALGYTCTLTGAITVKSITVNSALSLIGGVTLNTNGKTLSVTNGINVGAVSVLFPTLFSISGSGAVTINSVINTYDNAYLNFNSGTNITLSSITATTYSSSTINNDGTTTANSSTFQISGTSSSLSNTGTFSAGTTSTINLSGASSNITNSGTFSVGASSTVNVSGTSASVTSSSTFNMGPTSIIYLTGTSAAVTNSGTFTFQSDGTGSAAVGTIPSGTSGFTGQYAVQRYLTGGSTVSGSRYVYRGYRIMSSPVNAGLVSGNYPYTINYIATNAIVTGAKSSYSTVAGNPTLYAYSEDYTPSNASFTGGNFKGLTDISKLTSPYTQTITGNGTTKALYVGNGFLFFFRGDNTHSVGTSPGKTTYPYVAPESVTFTASGNLNQGTYTVANWQDPTKSLLYTTVAGNSAIMGFNMLGNPYASVIDWEATNSGGIVTTNVDPTVYVLNPVTNQYNSYSASTHAGNPVAFTGKIASGQGFFVKANNTGASVVFKETAKSPTTVINAASGNLMMGTPAGQAATQKLFRLRLSIDSLNYDDIAIGFKSTASSKYNPWEDSQYLTGFNAAEALSSMSADSVPVPLSINFLSLPKQTPAVIRLNVTAANSGRLTLEKTQLDSLSPIYEVWLMDKYKKDSLDIRHNSAYAFDIDKTDTASYGSNRFTLVIRQNKALGIHLLNFTAVKVSGGVQVQWKTENEQNYTNFTVERSTDRGTTFNVLGGFASNSQGIYTYMDANPANTADMYRVKVEDLNGAISYTPTITIIYNAGNQLVATSNINVYPNPSIGTINVNINQPASTNFSLSGVAGANSPSLRVDASAGYSIRIVSTSGVVIKSAVSTKPAWQDDVSAFPPGTYVMQVLNNKDKSLVGRTTFVKM